MIQKIWIRKFWKILQIKKNYLIEAYKAQIKKKNDISLITIKNCEPPYKKKDINRKDEDYGSSNSLQSKKYIININKNNIIKGKRKEKKKQM